MDSFKKSDTEKPRTDLLPPRALLDVSGVLKHGADKYGADNWKKGGKEAVDRYYAAALRHLLLWKAGELDDVESGLPHLAHASCCLLFMQELLRMEEGTPEEKYYVTTLNINGLYDIVERETHKIIRSNIETYRKACSKEKELNEMVEAQKEKARQSTPTHHV